MPMVFISQQTFPAVLERYPAAGLEVDYRKDASPLTAKALHSRVKQAAALHCLITDKVDEAALAAAPHLKIVANVGVGYDNIDVIAATARGILVSNTPDVLTDTTADLAMALVLATARRLSEADPYLRAGHFKQWSLFQPHLGLEVTRKTLGIYGMGRIGLAVAQRAALGFNMRVIYTARTPKPAADAFGAQRVDFDTLLAESDFLSLHAPLTPETRQRFTGREFAQMKPTAILINTARGPLVNEADLVAALDAGQIGGAGLDVYEFEPAVHPGLVTPRPHVVLTPHVGSATTETRLRMSLMAAENVIATFGGQRPPNALNPQVWKYPL